MVYVRGKVDEKERREKCDSECGDHWPNKPIYTNYSLSSINAYISEIIRFIKLYGS